MLPIASTGSTGIEVHAGVTSAMKLAGKVFHALHLDGLGRAAVGSLTMVVTLDGIVVRREPLYAGHFLECAPGDHQLTIAWHEAGPIAQAIEETATTRTVKVTVEPGRVTQVLYTGHRHSAEIEVVGTRPVGGLAPGASVVVAWSDGQRYPGRVLQTAREHTLVELSDGSRRWVPTEALSPA